MNELHPRKPLRKLAFLIPVIVAVIGAGWLGVTVYKEVHWKQFAVVVPEKVYRSGLLKEHQLESAIQSLKLRTVICLDAAEAPKERKLCQSHGVRFLSFDMHSSGKGSPADYQTVVETLADPASQPVLVHCRAGVARTGAAIALYRMAVDHWTYEQAITELRSFERKGRCEPELREMIAQIYREKLKSGLAVQSPSEVSR